MGQIKHKMGQVGGGVDISHKSKMSGKAKSLMSFPGGMPGPGEYGKAEGMPRIIGKGMAKYLAGESVGMRKMDPMYNGQPGVQQDDFEQFGAPKSTGPAKKTRSQRQEDRDKAKTKRRAKRADKRVERNKKKVEKLQSKIDQGKEIFNVDEAGNKTTGRKANRIEKAKKKITDNEKISAKKPKEEKTTSTRSYGMFKYDDGPMKTDPAKKKTKDPAKSDAGTVVSGDKSKVSKKTTGMSSAEKKAEMKRRKEFKSKVTQAKRDSKKEESAQMRQVQKDKRANEKVQRQRKSEGKDYVKYKKGTSKDGGAKESVVVRKKLKK